MSNSAIGAGASVHPTFDALHADRLQRAANAPLEFIGTPPETQALMSGVKEFRTGVFEAKAAVEALAKGHSPASLGAAQQRISSALTLGDAALLGKHIGASDGWEALPLLRRAQEYLGIAVHTDQPARATEMISWASHELNAAAKSASGFVGEVSQFLKFIK